MAWSAGLLLVPGTAVLLAQSLETFAAGDLVSAASFNANFTTLNTRIDTVGAKVDTEVAIAVPESSHGKLHGVRATGPRIEVWPRRATRSPE